MTTLEIKKLSDNSWSLTITPQEGIFPGDKSGVKSLTYVFASLAETTDQLIRLSETGWIA